jgi:hypothetical protein
MLGIVLLSKLKILALLQTVNTFTTRRRIVFLLDVLNALTGLTAAQLRVTVGVVTGVFTTRRVVGTDRVVTAGRVVPGRVVLATAVTLLIGNVGKTVILHRSNLTN